MEEFHLYVPRSVQSKIAYSILYGDRLSMPILFNLTKYFTNFTAVVCMKLTVPENGGVVPSSCALADVEYGTRCVFYCGDGYTLSGPRYTTCQNDTSWSEIGALSCVRGKNYF